ncbi:DUF3040 domain-containing protein [Lentzea jiangxiensis]|uniref:DUF3040 domain-containing protein n=1 Tax=Lentzea jiangxiensis TaxID=641025 RepID=A0A1H0J088_9PSEU|nr:DUF3040 domain-containing protein [Lentzea jiangxiensis]SDO37002.1 Protein of unknown function [Lentzea jiangxiensis]
MLSAQEQQQLLDIERWFRASDPDLARALGDGPEAQRRRQFAAVLLSVLAGVLVVALALLLL